MPSDTSYRTEYAGFWWRALAWLIDSVILWVVNGIIAFAGGMHAMFAYSYNPYAMHTGMMGAWFVILLIGLLYFPLFEASSMRGTPGKAICGLMVVDEDGNRISFLRSLGRNLGKILSSLILGIGFMMAGWTRRKQALHDMIASCLVVRRVRSEPAVPLPMAR